MNKAIEKILERFEELKECDLCNGMLCSECEEKYGDDNCGTRQQSLAIDECKAIVQEVAKEYSHLSKGSDSSLLKRIADYFSSEYEGDDKTAPKMELSVDDLRYIASLNVEKCRLQTEINNLKKLHEEYNNGWILCSKKLPEEKINPVTENYYVYPVIYKNEDIEDIKYYHYGKGHWYNGLQIMDDYVIAWFQLPDYM